MMGVVVNEDKMMGVVVMVMVAPAPPALPMKVLRCEIKTLGGVPSERLAVRIWANRAPVLKLAGLAVLFRNRQSSTSNRVCWLDITDPLVTAWPPHSEEAPNTGTLQRHSTVGWAQYQSSIRWGRHYQ
jgi:hypothetical protein